MWLTSDNPSQIKKNMYRPDGRNIHKDGVGLRFDGYPNDIERFNWVLAKEGCHPNATNRILSRITLNGYDLLTVMSLLNFDWIINELAKIGVTVTFITPLKGWKGTFEDGDWPKELMDKILKNRHQ